MNISIKISNYILFSTSSNNSFKQFHLLLLNKYKNKAYKKYVLYMNNEMQKAKINIFLK